MRRLMATTAFALFLAVPLWAQHGGGHGGGGHASFGGGHAGGGAHFSGGMHSAPSASRGFNHSASFSHGFSHRGISHARFGSRDPFLHDRFHGHRFNNFAFRNCFGFRCRGAYLYPWWGYDPYWWDSGSSYDDDYERDRETASEMNAQSLEEQRMREEEARDGDQDLYARSAPVAPPAPESPQPATVLVFRDQHQKEVRNYAIVGRTLWNFAPQRTEKIPLAELDLTATAKANDDRGLTFHVPGSAQAQ